MKILIALLAGVCLAQPAEEWPSYGRDAAETYYSPLDQIHAGNLARLSLAWSTRTGSPPGRVEATPILNDGVLYISLTRGAIVAIDARTGEIRWSWDPKLEMDSYSVCCGPLNRGVAVYRGKVYAGLIDGRLVALDQRTGRLVWSVQVTDPDSDESLTAAIRVFKGKLIVGSAGAEFAVRGHFSAYDPETGARLWRFYTVPGDPSKPFEHPELEMAAKTWSGKWWEMGGGGTVWQGMAYDADLDLLYIGTGNGGPWDREHRSPGGGDNLFLSSILAVRPDSGRLVWHFQTTPGDMWDYAATQSLILADIAIGGQTRKVVMQAPKNGFFYVLDRVTGEFISAAPYVKNMNWATGVDERGRPKENPAARYGKELVNLRPGPSGGHSWTPMAFSPRTGLAYVSGEETSGMMAHDPRFTKQLHDFNLGVLREFGPEPEGFLLAWDPVRNQQRWRVADETVGDQAGGVMVTASDLVFHGGAAFDAATGKKLWQTEVEIADRPGAWMSYALDGRQYVAVMARRWPEHAIFVFTLDGDGWFPWPLRRTLEPLLGYVGAGIAVAVLAIAGWIAFKLRGRLRRRLIG